MLFVTNQFLHIFGYALVFKYDDNNKINRVYPARVKFRGFSEKQAKRLIISANLTKIINNIPDELIKEEINEYVDKKIGE